MPDTESLKSHVNETILGLNVDAIALEIRSDSKALIKVSELIFNSILDADWRLHGRIKH